jgi:actin, other eukaryote
VLSLFATGRTTGTVVDSGDGITHTVPIYEGYALPFATTEIPICGRDLTKFMRHLLHAKQPQYIEENSEGFDTAEKIKCLHGKVALDYDAEIKALSDSNSHDTTYKLPGGQTIYLKDERLKCAEVLFTPSYDSNLKVEDGIHKFTYDAIIKCDQDIRKDLFHNIVLAGGGTMFEGMQERMNKEI